MTSYSKDIVSPQRVHLVGIGGVGMAALASWLVQRGVRVSGSDTIQNDRTRALEAAGVTVFKGHAPEHIGQAEAVVYSSAVKLDNCELVAAREKGLPLLPRARMLAQLTRGQRLIAIAGAHGKSTTSAMIARILWMAGRDPTVMVGAKMFEEGLEARVGHGEVSVIEVDESDGSFLFFRPWINVITNVDREHMDHYRDYGGVVEAFQRYAAQTQEDGWLILSESCSWLASSLPQNDPHRCVVYGGSAKNGYHARDVVWQAGRTSFQVWRGSDHLGDLTLILPGRHNIDNTLAAVAAADVMGISWEVTTAALLDFRGVRRRFELKGVAAGVCVVDDYAHHPTEIQAVLTAARSWHTGRLVVLFQPHRYSRLQHLWHEFKNSFDQADVVFVTDVYHAHEPAVIGISGRILADEMALRGRAVYFLPREDIVDSLVSFLKEGDCLLIIGAGDIYHIAEPILERLKMREQAGRSTKVSS